MHVLISVRSSLRNGELLNVAKKHTKIRPNSCISEIPNHHSIFTMNPHIAYFSRLRTLLKETTLSNWVVLNHACQMHDKLTAIRTPWEVTVPFNTRSSLRFYLSPNLLLYCWTLCVEYSLIQHLFLSNDICLPHMFCIDQLLPWSVNSINWVNFGYIVAMGGRSRFFYALCGLLGVQGSNACVNIYVPFSLNYYC